MGNKLAPLDQTQLTIKVREMVLKGYRTKDIYTYTKEHWSIEKRQTDRYIKEAHAAFLQIDKRTKEQLRSKYRERLEMMFHEALITKGDLRLALSMQCELNKLLNLYQDDLEATPPPVTLVFQTRGNQ